MDVELFSEEIERGEELEEDEALEDVERLSLENHDICEDDVEIAELDEDELEKAKEALANSESLSISKKMDDDDLFEVNSEGNYMYEETEFGKRAEGVLDLSGQGERNLQNQRTVGGEFRRDTDDGGHLIGHRFSGSSDFENLVPQDSNFNRSAYKALENEWEKLVEEGNKVYVNIDTYSNAGLERPDTFMGYYIVENPAGNRECNTFSFANESVCTQEKWNEINDEDL